MKEIDAEKFKEQCLALLDQIDSGGLTITKDGKPFARVVPYETGGTMPIGSLHHKIKINGSLFSTGLDWDATAQT